MSENEGMELVGGPADGWEVQPFAGSIHIPITGGRWGRMGETVEQVAVYTAGLDGRGHYQKPREAGK